MFFYHVVKLNKVYKQIDIWIMLLDFKSLQSALETLQVLNAKKCLVLKIPFSDHIFPTISKYRTENLHFRYTGKCCAPLPMTEYGFKQTFSYVIWVGVHFPGLPKKCHLHNSILKRDHHSTRWRVPFPHPELFKQLREVLSRCGGSEMKSI